MPNPNADRNMLFGILAMQMDFISREDLISATSTWVRDKSQPLDEILLARQMLGEEERNLLAALVDKHLENHGNDPARSLAAVGSLVTSVREGLGKLDDVEVAASLGHVSTAREDQDPHATIVPNERSPSPEERFRVLRPHAKGGLGEVFVARDEELNREVALKEIQLQHAFHAESQDRFLLEAEITGNLEHPGIVPVYSLGSYADGRPYYAMRFIRGDSLDDAIEAYHKNDLPAAEKNLQFRELMKRFVDVCDAIGYAHSRGVLHRDLKPGNIMLGQFGETLVVDWGLAKAVGSDSIISMLPCSEEPVMQPLSGTRDSATIAGQTVGTPGYMSPEQAAGRLDQLGPSTDVYSMGATLYHILVGRPSQAKKDLGKMLRDISDGKFPAPSEVDPTVSKPLETICLKAMARDPEDRYPSVSELAVDVDRWLADEPVTAWQEPLVVRTRRWIRRHPTLTATVSTVALASLLGLVVFSAIVAGQKREMALKNSALQVAQEQLENQKRELELKNSALVTTQKQLDARNSQLEQSNRDLTSAEERARSGEALARSEAETANKVSAFLRGILEETDPVALSGRLFAPTAKIGVTDRSIRDVVQAGTDQLSDGSFAKRDKTRAMLLHTLGNIWVSYGDTETAARLLRESRDIREEILPPGHKDRMASLHSAGRVEAFLGHGPEADKLLGQAMEQCRALLSRQPDGQRKELEVQLANILWDLGAHRAANEGRYADNGQGLLEQSLEIRRRHFDADSREVFMSLLALAASNFVNENRVRALKYLVPARAALLKMKGGKQFDAAMGQLLRAQWSHTLGRFDETENAYRECVRLLEVAMGENHMAVTWARRQLAGFLYWEQEDSVAAEKEWLRVLEDYRTMVGPDHNLVAEALTQLCRCRRNLKDYATAKAHGRRGMEIYVADPLSDLEGFATCLDVWMAVLYFDARREYAQDGIQLGPAFEEAEGSYQQIIDVLEPRATVPIDKSDKVLRLSRQHLADAAQKRVAWTTAALADWEHVLEADEQTLPATLELRARLLADRDRMAEAAQAARKLRELAGTTRRQLYGAARVFSRCAAAIEPDDDKQLTEEQIGRRQRYVNDAIAVLEQAISAGWADLATMQTDTSLSVLHDLPEFKTLIEAGEESRKDPSRE